MNENPDPNRPTSRDLKSLPIKKLKLNSGPGSILPMRSLRGQSSEAELASRQPNNPLHGIKLADMIEYLVAQYGWEELGVRINIKCFKSDPSVKSSLKFLRKTPWARQKVEQLYLYAKRKRGEG